MKKYTAVFCGALMFSSVCWGQLACSGGSVVVGNTDGNPTPRLCISNRPMTWYAAHSWCAANHGKLVLEATVANRVMRNSSNNKQWGFVNRVNGKNVFRVNLYNANNNGGVVGSTSTINRPVGTTAITGEKSNNGAIIDMYALCQPLNDADTY